MTSKHLLRQLQCVDWDFPAELPGATQPLHWYPGTFPPQVPATLVQALSEPEDLIFDPFGGIGTTGGESVRLGRRSWLADSNPIAVLTSYVKCALILLKIRDPDLYDKLFAGMAAFLSSFQPNSATALDLGLTSFPAPSVDDLLSTMLRPKPDSLFEKIVLSHPNRELLAVWIEHRTLQDVLSIWNEMTPVNCGYFGKLLGLTMLSAILKPSSSQTRSWGHIADNVLPKDYSRKDVYSLCRRWQVRTKNVIDRIRVSIPDTINQKKVQVWISLHDWSKEESPTPAPRLFPKVLITSPPYGGAIDYTLAQRLSLYFLGFDDQMVQDLCHLEIGARRKRFASNYKEGWADDLVCALRKQLRFLNDSSTVVLVLPHKDAGREIGTNLVGNYMAESGWYPILKFERSIRQSRTRQSWTSIKKESITVYSKES